MLKVNKNLITLPDIDLTTINNTIISGPMQSTYTRGTTYFELSNHLGNVLAVVTDRKLAQPDGGTGISYYLPDIVSATDYYPFGYAMEGRGFSSDNYRYGFNGMEKDNELKGSGNSYDFGARLLDVRLGRWLAVDPLAGKYPENSPYCFSLNTPVLCMDPDGEDPVSAIGDAVFAFALEVGVHVLSEMLLNDQSVTDAFSSVEWGDATYEAGKAYVYSFIIPGTGMAKKVASVAKKPIGKIAISFSKGVAEQIMDNYLKGKYDDEDGDFDYEKLFNEDELLDVTTTVLINTLIDQGFSKKAKSIAAKYKKTDQFLSKSKENLEKQMQKMAKLKAKSPNNSQAIANRQKKIDKARSDITKAKNTKKDLAKSAANTSKDSSTVKKTAGAVKKKVTNTEDNSN